MFENAGSKKPAWIQTYSNQCENHAFWWNWLGLSIKLASKPMQEFVETKKLKKEFVMIVKRKHLNSLKTENENYKKKRIPR